MKAGLITHSTETVATSAVTSAGIAATSENSATTRLCSRAPARAARRAARKRRSSSAISTSRQRTIRPSPPSKISTTPGVGMIGVNPAKVTKVASARASAPPTAIGPNTPEIRRSSNRGPSSCAGLPGCCCNGDEVTLPIFAVVAVCGRAQSCPTATLLQDYDEMAARLT